MSVTKPSGNSLQVESTRASDIALVRSSAKTVIAELFPIVGIATLLRFWKLEAKPLWGDELHTAFYSLGKNLSEIPVDVLSPVSRYWTLLDYPFDSTVWQAAYTVTTYSNHPPLFFMLMNQWLRWCGSSIWSLRALPVFFGILSVVGSYCLGCIAGGNKVGRYTALLMAVSPYSLYLSQEARHYSLAVAIATFSLTLWLSLLKDNQQKQAKAHWAAWILLNSFGFWVHYFYSFCIAAQWGVVLARLWQQRSNANSKVLARRWRWAMGFTLLLCSPLLATALTHFQGEGGISWLSRSLPWWQTILLPWVQSIAAGVFTLILLPVEESPLWITVPSAIVMWGVFWLIIQQGVVGWKSASLSLRSQPLVGYSLGVFALMLSVTYGLGKDVTLAPRYFFAVYPAVTAIIAVGLARRHQRILGLAIAAGLLSQVFIAHDLALFKPYLPGQIGMHLAANHQPTVVLMSPQPPHYDSRVLSYILAIPPDSDTLVGIVEPTSSEDWVLNLSGVETFADDSFTLWLVEVHRQVPFAPEVTLPRHSCTRQGEALTTKGTQQQKYQCDALPTKRV